MHEKERREFIMADEAEENENILPSSGLTATLKRPSGGFASS